MSVGWLESNFSQEQRRQDITPLGNDVTGYIRKWRSSQHLDAQTLFLSLF